MKFDFDTVIPRRNTNSYKWDCNPDVLPMWVADMDFKAAPCILEALQKKLDHGVFGYTKTPESYYQALIRWFGRRYGWKIEREWCEPICGIVSGTALTIKALTDPGDKVLMQVPAYNCFFRCIRDDECELQETRLVYDREQRRYTIDFNEFERQVKDAKVFLLCNPHNPTGRLWTKEELTRMGEICMKYGVPVISDEIHCEIVPPGSSYTPFAGISEEFASNCVTFVSPSKPFNIAGLENACIVSKNAEFMSRIRRQIEIWKHEDVNQFGTVAFEAAYSEQGEEWLNEMNAYVHENFEVLKGLFAKELPDLPLIELEATYLVWMDISSLGIGSKEISESLKANEKVWINGGDMYGDDKFMRINIACPRKTLLEGAKLIIKGINRIKNA